METSLMSGAGFAMCGALLLASCGGGGTSSPSAPSAAPATAATTPAAPAPAPAAATVTVNIVSSTGNGAFQPNPVMANSGDTVMFRNGTATTHHIVMDDGSADLGEVAPGAASKGLSLKNGDAARFHCTIHSSMVGSVNGAVAPTPPPCTNPYGYGC